MTDRLKKTEETRPLLTGIKTSSLHVPHTVKRVMEDTNTVLEIEIPEEKSTDSTTSTDGLKNHSDSVKSMDFDSDIVTVPNSSPSGEDIEETDSKGQFQSVANTEKSETACSNFDCGKNNEEGTKNIPVLLTDSKVVVGTGDPPIASKNEGKNVTTGPKITVMDDDKSRSDIDHGNTLELACVSAQQRKASDAGSEYHDCASSISRQSVGNLSLTSSSPSDSHLEEMDIRVELAKKMKKSPSGSSICTFPTQSTLTDFCRICHCDGDAELGPLIAPCHCRGSLRYVHQSCLQQWIKSSDSKQCELCGYQFIMDSKLKPFHKWKKLSMTTAERRKIMCSVVFHVIAITCVIWSLFVLINSTANEIKAGQLQWPFWTKLVVVAIGFTGGLVFMYVQCKVYVQLWRRLKAFNRVIYVKNNTPSGTNTPGGNSANDEIIPVAVGESIGSISTSNQQQQQQVSSVQSPQSNEAVNIELELTKL